MILVTGATGNVGGEVAGALAARGEDVRAVVRDPARANLPAAVEVVQGDLDLPESLTPALDEPLTPGDQLATLAAVLGRPLRYEPLSDEQARLQMAADTPAPYIDAFFRFYSDGEFDDSPVLDTVEQITGRTPRRFEQWARTRATAFE